MFISDKKIKDFEELAGIYRGQISDLKTEIENKGFVHVPVPQQSDQVAYQTKIAALSEDPLYLFYFSQLRKSAVDGFERHGKDQAEFYRGKLSAIADVLSDARTARSALQGVGNAV
jgi:hypothetical protein